MNIKDYLGCYDKKNPENIYISSFTYRMRFYNILNILFTWDSDQIDILKKIELLLHVNGSVGYDLKHNKWVIGKWNSILDDNGDYLEYACHTLSTTDKEMYILKNHSEVVVCGNNSLYTTDNDFIKYFADTLQETDISIYHQLMNSRNIPILSGVDDITRKDIENLFNQRKAGQPVAIGTNLVDDVKTLDICDNATVDRLSTLDNFHEELIKRFCNGFGIDIETKEKKAQVNEMELDSFGDYSTLYFLIMLIAREEFCKEMEEKGIKISCQKNPVFWDEPTIDDVREGSFEAMEVEKETNDENKDSDSETNSESTENTESSSDDDK